MARDSWVSVRLEGGNERILSRPGVCATLKLAACEMLRQPGRTRALIHTEACIASVATEREEARHKKIKGLSIKFTAVIERNNKGCGVTFLLSKADLALGVKILEREGIADIFSLQGGTLYCPPLLARFDNLRSASK